MAQLPAYVPEHPTGALVDDLTPLLEELRIKTTLFGLANVPRDWGVEFPPGRGSYFHVVDGGAGWLHLDRQQPVRVAPGDVVLLARGTAHKITGTAEGIARVRFDPLTWKPNEISQAARRDGSPSGITLVCGAVHTQTRGRHPLLDLLPVVFQVSADDPTAQHVARALTLITDEASAGRLGGQAVLARLGDVLLIQLVRAWLEQGTLVGAGWLTALRDPQLGPMIVAVHADLGAPWTLDSMARLAGLSRSRFAERFAGLVGVAPVTYLTRWRMERARDLLEAGRSIRHVSRSVGYSSEQSFSRAFARQYGVAPGRLAPVQA
jgi:AraC-like DNA-binding protein